MPTPLSPTVFVTFGMFILDEIEWQTENPPPPKSNLIGGAGTYAILGARLASSPCQLLAQSISWIVDVGSDFPTRVRSDIDSWNTDCIFRTDSTRLTTRAWNGYGAGEFRSFKYLTPKIRLEVSSLQERQLRSKSFHMVCSPDRCLDLTSGLKKARDQLVPAPSIHPILVWEPIPDLCSPAELRRLQQAAAQCSVISPNHDELKMFFRPEVSALESQEQLAKRLMGWNDAELGETNATMPFLVVREGSNGSTAYFNHLAPVHVPAYHNSQMARSVVDPTGGGNTYLGALAIALTGDLFHQPTYEALQTALHLPSAHGKTSQQILHQIGLRKSVTLAMLYASVAASFAIEQNGTPSLEKQMIFTEIAEYWNGQTPISRLRTYLDRETSYILQQFDI